MKDAQISAVVSESTRQLLERYSRATGVKKGHLIEQALRHHLLALDELPHEFIIHPRVVVSAETGKRLLAKMRDGEPTPALRALLRDGD